MGPAANAQVVSGAPDSVAVTIYRDYQGVGSDGWDAPRSGLVFVTETRTIDVPAGSSRISFLGVADGMAPQTAKLDGLPGETIEHNFDDNLLTPGSLLAKSIGRPARLIRTNRGTGESTGQDVVVRAAPDGVVVQTSHGLEALNCSGAPERLVFDQAPEGLADRPTLSVQVRAASAGRHRVQLSYLALGLGWSANYVARIRPDDQTLDLSGWITLVNPGDTSFVDAPTAVVAGTLSRVQDADSVAHPQRAALAPRCWPLSIDWSKPEVDVRALARLARQSVSYPSAAPVITVRGEASMTELGDYKLYTLPEPTTILAHQTKQVQLLSRAGVRFDRVYGYRFDPEAQHDGGPFAAATVSLRLRNREADGLGLPLPSGTMTVMELGPRGEPVLTGHARVQDTAVGMPFEIELGRALDVWTRPRIVAEHSMSQRGGKRVRRYAEVTIGNDKADPVRFELRQAVGEDFRVISESSRHALQAGEPLWAFTLGAGERRVLRYVAEQASPDL